MKYFSYVPNNINNRHEALNYLTIITKDRPDGYWALLKKGYDEIEHGNLQHGIEFFEQAKYYEININKNPICKVFDQLVHRLKKLITI